MSSQGLRRPIIDVVTRWNSTFDMLKSLLGYKEFCFNHIDEKLQLTDTEWNEINELVTVLEPVSVATVKLQSSQLFLGDFCILWMQLKLQLQSNTSTNSQLLFNCFEKREPQIFDNPTVLSCMYLDPRIRRLVITNPIKMLKCKGHLKQLIRQMITLKNKQIPKVENEPNNQQEQSVEASGKELQELPTQSSNSLLGSFLNSIVVSPADEESEDEDRDGELKSAFSEIESYTPKPIDINASLMEYWQEKRFIYPYLYSLAQVIHSVPATQVSVERSFSALRLFLSDLRCNLSPEILNKIMFLNAN